MSELHMQGWCGNSSAEVAFQADSIHQSGHVTFQFNQLNTPVGYTVHFSFEVLDNIILEYQKYRAEMPKPL